MTSTPYSMSANVRHQYVEHVHRGQLAGLKVKKSLNLWTGAGTNIMSMLMWRHGADEVT